MENSSIAIRPRRFRRGRFVWILGFLAVAVIVSEAIKIPTGPAQGTGLAGPSVSGPEGDSFRVGTFNIDGGMGTDDVTDLDRTARCLQHLDFIGLNEVHGGMFDNQAHILSEKLKLPFMYEPVERQWWHESFGNAIFSDMPIEHWERVVLPNRWLQPYRNYVLTDVRWHKKNVHFLTTHIEWKSGGVEQRQIVSDLFLSLPTPAILMGDLNAPPGDEQIKRLHETPGVEEAINAILGDQPHRIDWIFLRGLETMDAGIVNIGASDHPAYWAQVRVK
jgi:endonuclease/exonuclease/phosphatase family metal-dependent hydrolase